MNTSNSSYLSHLIHKINQRLEAAPPTLLYGENINHGSCISGLARGIVTGERHRILNVGNGELTHIGMGMGIMLDGGNAILFVKQSDFLLLGLDHVVNSFNLIRASRNLEQLGSFTIYSIICDQGYQGPQSSLNSPYDFASLGNVSTFCLNCTADSEWVMNNQFINPGFRFVFVSQRSLTELSYSPTQLGCEPNGSIFWFGSGNFATIVCVGFTLKSGMDLATHMTRAGAPIDLYQVNYRPNMELHDILASCARTGKLVILDDSKSVTKLGDLIACSAAENIPGVKVKHVTRRGLANLDYCVNPDQYIPDINDIANFILRS